MSTQHYDFIIVGSGAAGLSLAYHLINSPLRDRSILIVDRAPKERNDRTFCFWTDQPAPFEQIVYRSWDQLRVVTADSAQTIALRPLIPRSMSRSFPRLFRLTPGAMQPVIEGTPAAPFDCAGRRRLNQPPRTP